MMTPLVIIPARAGSKGVPNKNFRELPDGSTLLWRAIDLGREIGHVVVTSDAPYDQFVSDIGIWIDRQAALAQDDTPMSAVVEDVLARVDGPPEQPIVLLQPTVPFRTVEQVRACLTQKWKHLRPMATMRAIPERYWRAFDMWTDDGNGNTIGATTVWLPERRQMAEPLYMLSGTAYVWPRRKGKFPAEWHMHIEDGEPYVNVDEESDWQRACEIIRNRQTASADTR